jgi:hypothetical protein
MPRDSDGRRFFGHRARKSNGELSRPSTRSGSRRTPGRGRGAPRCTQRLRAATSRPAGQGEQAGGAGEEEGEEEEYEVEEILNKQAVKRSSSRTARTAVSWKGSPRDDAT